MQEWRRVRNKYQIIYQETYDQTEMQFICTTQTFEDAILQQKKPTPTPHPQKVSNNNSLIIDESLTFLSGPLFLCPSLLLPVSL